MTMNKDTTLQQVLEASHDLVLEHMKLVAFIVQTFGEDALEEYGIYCDGIAKTFSESLSFTSKDGKIIIE